MSYQSYSCAAVECAGSTEGTPVVRCAESDSIISQADADKKAQIAAQTTAYGALDCGLPVPPQPTVYLSAGPLTGNLVCPTCAGSSSTAVTVPAGAFYSMISQAAADSAAAAELARLTNSSRCTGTLFYNDPQVASASCPMGAEGPAASFTVGAGAYCSDVSKVNANALAAAAAQAGALAALSCLYYNAEQTATATCAVSSPDPTKLKGPVSTATVAAAAYTSVVSFAAANATALAAAQAAAIAGLTCYTYGNAQQTSDTPDCESAFGPSYSGPAAAAVVQPADTYFSDVSQANANTLAKSAADAEYLTHLLCEFDPTPPP